MSLLGILIALWGCVVQVFAAVVESGLGFELSNFTLGDLPHFLLTFSIYRFCFVHINFQLNVNKHVQYS